MLCIIKIFFFFPNFVSFFPPFLSRTPQYYAPKSLVTKATSQLDPPGSLRRSPNSLFGWGT